MRSKSPAEVARALELGWVSWAGVPRAVLADNGGEVYPGFEEYLTGLGARMIYTSVESPWPNGICERTGGVWKTIWNASLQENHFPNQLSYKYCMFANACRDERRAASVVTS